MLPLLHIHCSLFINSWATMMTLVTNNNDPPTTMRTMQPGSSNQHCCQHQPNQLKCIMSFLYNTNMAIKEHLKRVQGYRMEGCGLWCHGLLVFKQRLGSIKATSTSASGVSLNPSPVIWWFTHPSLYKQLSRRWKQSLLIKNTSDFICKYMEICKNRINKWSAHGMCLGKQWLDSITQALSLIPSYNNAEGTGPRHYSLLLVIHWDYGHIASIT